MNGKSKCKILKDIRKKIAEDNDITYVTSECKFQGDCTGTCPKCEAELRYLEEELAKRKNLGKTIAVAGIATALVVASTGCAVGIQNQADNARPSHDTPHQAQPSTVDSSTTELILGEMPIVDPTDVLMGDIAETEGPSDELLGRIAPTEDSTWWD